MGFDVRLKRGYLFVALTVLSVFACASPCHAARFRLIVPQPAAPVGQESEAFVVLVPDPGEKVMGAWLTLTVNKDFLLLLGDRSQYASDPVFSKVEKFSADPLTGALTYRVQTDEPLDEPKVLLRVPLKFVQVGVSSITFTTSYYGADMTRLPANSGYQRVAGYKDAPDPLLLSSLFGENNTLDGLSLAGNLAIVHTAEQSIEAIEMDLGVTELAVVQSDEQADVVIEFSKRVKTIGRGQWVRLDVMITKFPEYETLGGVQFKVKYDPNYFTYNDDKGQEASAVVLNSVFNLGFVNKVDRVKGEIDLSLGVDLLLKDQTLLKPPVSTVSLYFKCMREGTGTVSLEQIKVPVSRQGSTLAKHDAIINISGGEKGCDGDLPATLCSGSFKTRGTASFSFNNQNETTRPVVRTLDETGEIIEDPQLKIRRFTLEQTWNLNMDGSFKNGVRMQGHIIKNPHQEQLLSISLIGADTTAMFGDLSISFAESDLVALTSSEATGLLFEHKYKGLDLRILTAQLNSSSASGNIAGEGHRGPYVIPITGTIIQPSFGVFKDNNKLEPNEYTVDFGNRQIFLVEPLLKGENIVLSCKVSSSLFSTGNIQAARVNYANKQDTFHIGTTYITTESPKSNTFVKLSASEAVESKNLVSFALPDGTATTTYVCGYFGDHLCSEIQLKNQYIVRGTVNLQIVTTSGSAQYREGDPFVYIDHRGYLEGRVFVDRTKFNTIDLTASYSYYNPGVITQQSFVIYEIDGKDSTLNDLGRWRTDMFPGSEALYLSDDTNNDVTEGQDKIVCYKGQAGVYDVDETFVCPGSYIINSNLTYYIQGSDSNQYVQLSSLVSGKKYLKIKYIPIPPDIAGGSEFKKVAWGLDARFKLGSKITVKAEYAQANSDLSSSFNTTREVVYVDSITTPLESHNDPNFNTCWYVQEEDTGINDEYLACRLSRSNLFGSVNIKYQMCKTTDTDLTRCEEYYPTETDVLIPMSDVNLKDGIIYFWRRSRWPQASSEEFPSYGDKFYVTYTYDQTLDQVVTGEAMILDLAYDSRRYKLNLKRRTRDPLFDSDVSRYKDNITEQLSGDFAMTISSRWSMSYDFKDSQAETVDQSGKLNSLSQQPSSTFSLKYSPSILNNIQYLKSENKSSGYSLGALGQKTETDSSKNNETISVTAATKNGRYSIIGKIARDQTQYRMGTEQNTESKTQTLGFNYKPSKKFTLAHDLSITKTSPTGSRNISRGFTLTLKTFTFVDITLGFRQDRNRSLATEPTQFNEIKNYSLTFKPLYGLEGLSFNFTRNDKPGGTTTQLYRQRNDNMSLGFRTKIKKTISFNPMYSRTTASTETQTWSLSHSLNWTLEYKPQTRYNTSVKLTQSRSSSTNQTNAGVITDNSSNTRALSVDLNPTKRTHSTITLDRSMGASVSRSINMQLRFTLMDNLLLETRTTTTRSFGINPSKTIGNSLGLKWTLNPDTDMSMDYSRSVTRGATASQSQPANTLFSTKITAKFK